MNLNQEAYSSRTAALFQSVLQFAAQMGHDFIGSEHVLWGVAKEGGAAARVLKNHGLEADLIAAYVQQSGGNTANTGGMRVLQFSGEMEKIIKNAGKLAEETHCEKIDPEHLLIGVLRERKNAACQLILSLDLDPDSIAQELTARMQSAGWETKPEQNKASKTLDRFSRDLTAAAQSGKLDPMIGRESEAERLVQVLSRRTKNNPVLIGEPGVGKTAVAEGLAQRIVEGRVPKNLKEKRILSLDLTGMISGTRFRGDFEERIQAFLDDAIKAGDVILFLDELHMLVGAGAGSGEGTMDAANIFKPVLGRGELQVIGATTLKEYRKHIEKDAALERRFQPVMVEQPTREDSIQILMGLRERYESFHELTITDDAVTAAVELSERYIQDRFLPDKAIDLLDEAAARIRTRGITVPPHLQALDEEIGSIQNAKLEAAAAQEYERAASLRDHKADLERQLKEKQDEWQRTQGSRVDAEDVAEVVSAWTKIPATMLTQDESERLLRLEDELHKRVIGQDEAVTAVAQAIRRGRTGVAEPNRPTGSFLFLGPTGVGKTELCRALAEVMFQDEESIIRLDMSEYMERHTVSRLIGSPPGYVGYDEGGQLTERVRRKPYSIVLFDEIEKAHPDVWNTLLQIMDDGRLTDAQGRVVSFKNTIIAMTSNIGAREITGKVSLGFSRIEESGETRSAGLIKSRVMDEVKKTFPPEFLNRLDETIVFHQLGKEHVRTIARNLTDRLVGRMAQRDICLVVEDSAVDILADKGFDPDYGARPLRRAIQSVLETKVAQKMLEDGLSTGDKITVSGKDGEIFLRAQTRQTAGKLVDA
ncbi:MAG: ATP-dependent Clp protease ATP-binding subunit [Christensenellaceae bacterium]|jgi:ATP-dependent Clp protease ATP-binding subunit ClpC